MGTTVTTNLGLIKPDTDEKIKEDLPTFDGWAAQNEANMDTIDALFRASDSTYTPTWGASVTPPTLGAGGFTEGKVIRLWPRMVVVFFRIFTGGAGFLDGSGNYTLNLPVAIDPSFSAFSHTMPIGKMIFLDSSAIVSSSVFPLIYSPASNLIFARPSEGGTWTDVLPVVPGQNDRFSGYFMYPTAVA
jgi:hypothetical protein